MTESMTDKKQAREQSLKVRTASMQTTELIGQSVAPVWQPSRHGVGFQLSCRIDAAGAVATQVIPLGRIGDPDEAAAAYEFLLHLANSYITAQTIMVDGGLGSIRTTSPSNESARDMQGSG